jgi:hypothetical protein
MITNAPTSIQLAGNPLLFGPVQFVQGSNMTLSQSGQQITFASTGGGGGSGFTLNVSGTSVGSAASTLNVIASGDITLLGTQPGGINTLKIGTSVPHGVQVWCTINTSTTASNGTNGYNNPQPFNTVIVDINNDGFWSASHSTRLTVPAGLAGWYDVFGQGAFSSGTAQIYMALCINGNYIYPIAVSEVSVEAPPSNLPSTFMNGTWQPGQVSALGWYFNAGDYVELCFIMYFNSNATKTVYSVQNYSPYLTLIKRA